MQIGQISYTRPDYPITHSEIEHILAVAGKDVIRLAWSSLAPYSCEHYEQDYRCKRGPYMATFCTKIIPREDLGSWFCQFFNLKKNCGQGNACINQLCDSGLLISYACVSKFETFLQSTQRYATVCGPAFKL